MTTSDARKRLAEAEQTAADGGTVAALLGQTLAEHEVNLRFLWRNLAEKRIEHGVDWPYIVRTLFADMDRIAAALPTAAPAQHVVHVTAEPIAEDVVWCDECEEWVTSGAPEAPTAAPAQDPTPAHIETRAGGCSCGWTPPPNPVTGWGTFSAHGAAAMQGREAAPAQGDVVLDGPSFGDYWPADAPGDRLTEDERDAQSDLAEGLRIVTAWSDRNEDMREAADMLARVRDHLASRQRPEAVIAAEALREAADDVCSCPERPFRLLGVHGLRDAGPDEHASGCPALVLRDSAARLAEPTPDGA